MSDTSHLHATPPVEGDGINYRGIVWFIVVLTATTFFCQALVWGMFKYMEHRENNTGVLRAPLSVPAGQKPPAPNLLTDEAGNLREFRQKEQQALTTYGWTDQASQIVRLPVDRAKALVLERGLPARSEKPEAASQKPGAGTPKPEVGSQK